MIGLMFWMTVRNIYPCNLLSVSCLLLDERDDFLKYRDELCDLGVHYKCTIMLSMYYIGLNTMYTTV